MMLPEIVNQTQHSIFVRIPPLNDEFSFGSLVIVMQKFPSSDKEKWMVDDEIVRLTDDMPCLRTGKTWISTDLEVRTTTYLA